MEGGTISPVLLENERLPCSSREVLDSLWISNSPPPAFHGIEFILSFFFLVALFLVYTSILVGVVLLYAVCCCVLPVGYKINAFSLI